jgi:activator of 2-hydroxyglutaryl-CoA dehydratase
MVSLELVKSPFFDTIESREMSYFLGVDVGSVNAKLALIDEKGGFVEFDTEETGSSPRAAVSSIIARLGERFNLEDIVAAGVSGSGRAVIPKNLAGWNTAAHW